MLSYIYQFAYRFENNHKLWPNTLYLNQRHYQQLCNEFINPADTSSILSHLSMVLVITDDAEHPHLAYLRSTWLDRSKQGARNSGYNSKDALASQLE